MFNKATVFRLSSLVLLSTFLLPVPIIANELQITPYIGYRAGGEFDDFATGTKLKLDEGESYGLIVGREGSFEFLYSLQPSKLNARGPVTSAQLFDIDVINIMLTGKNVLDQDLGTLFGWASSAISPISKRTRTPRSAALTSVSRNNPHQVALRQYCASMQRSASVTSAAFAMKSSSPLLSR
ncbi:MAG: hypothetical protein GY935_20235 [Gammaproteobacteria bacterium]|nr:hypothetical protein [Gammaproteobacteria bacterium]